MLMLVKMTRVRLPDDAEEEGDGLWLGDEDKYGCIEGLLDGDSGQRGDTMSIMNKGYCLLYLGFDKWRDV